MEVVALARGNPQEVLARLRDQEHDLREVLDHPDLQEASALDVLGQFFIGCGVGDPGARALRLGREAGIDHGVPLEHCDMADRIRLVELYGTPRLRLAA